MWSDRAPPRGSPGATPEDHSKHEPEPRLRLAVSRGGIGFELSEPFSPDERTGLWVREVATSLTAVKYPIDLSGGWARFRHCRSVLTRLVIEIDRDRLARWLAPLISTTVLAADERVDVAISGARLSSQRGWQLGASWGARSIAWDLFWCPEEGSPAVIVDNARAVSIDDTAHRTALAITDAALRGFATREGSLFVLGAATSMIVREVFHRVGARTPSAAVLGWSAPEETRSGWVLRGESEVESEPPTRVTIAARETTRLTRTADDLEIAMRLDEARDARLVSLERSNGHPTVARRLADLDRSIGGRVEAALSSIAVASPVLEGGILAAELLAAAGDLDTAVIAAQHAAEVEPYAPLAALSLGRAATWADDPRERVRLLDAAVARAPSRASLRWQRFEAALSVANERAALTDLEHLEAIAGGPQQRHDVIVRAATMLLSRGHAALAVSALERALRARPTSEPALIALGKSLAAAGSAERAAEVLARVIALADRRHAPCDEALVALGRVLGDSLGELSLALGRLRTVSSTSLEATEARFLEGRYLSRLGDRAAASQAFSRMAERISAVDREASSDDRSRFASWLEEAAKHASDVGDLAAARTHLGAALRLLPRDRRLQSEFRRVATSLASMVDSPASGSVGAPRTPNND